MAKVNVKGHWIDKNEVEKTRVSYFSQAGGKESAFMEQGQWLKKNFVTADLKLFFGTTQNCQCH